jgi:hypothetical protein
MKKTNLTLKKKDFLAYYLRKLTKDGSIITIISLFIFSIASIIYNKNHYYLLLLFMTFSILYTIKILKTIKRNENKPFSLSITSNEYEILRPNEKGKMVSTFFESFRSFLKYDKFKNYIFLYVQKRMVFILNKDWFTDDEWNQLNKSIETQVRYKKLNTFILFLHVLVCIMLIGSIITGFIK